MNNPGYRMSGFLISAARKSSGKTSFSAGLAALLDGRGHRVQTYKKGPDYIDPMWLSQASRRPCINLDFFTMSRDEIERTYRRYGAGADTIMIEGNKGLYDGVDARGADCNAALAKMLDLPVILLLDVSGITRGVAPLVHGYQTFDKETKIAGVVLNKVAGDRHEGKLRAALDYYVDIPVLGAIQRSREMEIEERHIGLIPSNEDHAARSRVQAMARAIENSVDVDKILMLTRTGDEVSKGPESPPDRALAGEIRIGVARDEAFGFYYPDDLETLVRLGADVYYFDTLRDSALPDVDAIFIGGGFPEFYLNELEANTGLRAELKRFIDDGRPVYAECGGLMYLCQDIEFSGATRSMVGALGANVKMKSRPVGRGYVRLVEKLNHPWPSLGGATSESLPVHEFHYSQLENLHNDVEFAYRVLRGVGIRDRLDGLIHKNTLATFTHHRNVGCNRWAERFVAHIHKWKNRTQHRIAM